MNKTEFLETLRGQLSGQIQSGRADAHVRYYRDYIEAQLRSGRTEEEILAELGDPRLIAKTLLDTDPESSQEIYGNSYGYAEQEYDSQQYSRDSYNRSAYEKDQQKNVKHRTYKLDLTTWYGKAIVIAVAAMIIIGLILLIGTVLPIIIIAALIISFISWLRRRL